MNPLLLAKLELYGGILLAVTLCFMAAYFYGHHQGFKEEKAEYDAFVVKVDAAGREAQLKADQQKAEDKLAKEKADDENRKTIAALTGTITSLRNSRPAGNLVPPAPAGSKRPDLVCFDRSSYQSAYGGLVKEVRGLSDEGTAATVDLNTAKAWARPPK